jgi:solute:Na+ symporter, SSS family
VLALTLAAFLLALTSERIKGLVEIASAFGSAGVFVTAVFGMFTRFGGAWAAATSICTGTIVWAVGHFAFEWSAPYLLAIGCSAAVYIAVAIVEHGWSRESHVQAAGDSS